MGESCLFVDQSWLSSNLQEGEEPFAGLFAGKVFKQGELVTM